MAGATWSGILNAHPANSKMKNPTALARTSFLSEKIRRNACVALLTLLLLLDLPIIRYFPGARFCCFFTAQALEQEPYRLGETLAILGTASS